MLQKRFKFTSSNKVEIDKDLFFQFIRSALRAKGEFDEKYYLSLYTDVEKGIRSGKIESALDHWIEAGYFEGRRPKRFIVDEDFYLKTNKDVAAALKKGIVVSAQQHFESNGLEEGRLPFKDFSLF